MEIIFYIILGTFFSYIIPYLVKRGWEDAKNGSFSARLKSTGIKIDTRESKGIEMLEQIIKMKKDDDEKDKTE